MKKYFAFESLYLKNNLLHKYSQKIKKSLLLIHIIRKCNLHLSSSGVSYWLNVNLNGVKHQLLVSKTKIRKKTTFPCFQLHEATFYLLNTYLYKAVALLSVTLLKSLISAFKTRHHLIYRMLCTFSCRLSHSHLCYTF